MSIEHSNISDTLASAVNDCLTEALLTRHTTSVPKTLFVLGSLAGRIDFIAESIFPLDEGQHIYSQRILSRSLIDHFLKHQFIFVEWAKSKDDTCASAYLSYYLWNEELQLSSAYQRQGKLFGGATNAARIDVVRHFHPEAANISEDDIRNHAARFSYKRIIDSLSADIYKTGYTSLDAFLPKILPIYSDLSSIVHGGAFADLIMASLADDNKREAACKAESDLALSISASAKMFTLIFLSNVNGKYLESLIGYRKLLKQFDLPGGA